MRGGQYRGTALNYVRSNKERTCPEVLQDRRCRLVVFGIEIGGRWSDEVATFLRLLAQTKARQAPAILRHSFTTALIHCWSARLTHPATHAFAASPGNLQPLPLQLTTCPLLRRTTWIWLSPMRIRGPLLYERPPSCQMPGD